MAEKPDKEFGTRKPVAIQPAQPVKRGQVALLLMGTFAIGGGAYALMPGANCETRPGMAAPSGLQTNAECAPRGSSSSSSHGGSGGSSGFSSRNSFYGDSSSTHTSSGTSSDSGSGHVTRGGFGGFAHSFGSHFSGGG
jgi:hypothetical protein